MRFCKSFDHIMLLPCACRQILGYYVTYSYLYEYFSMYTNCNKFSQHLAGQCLLNLSSIYATQSFQPDFEPDFQWDTKVSFFGQCSDQ